MGEEERQSQGIGAISAIGNAKMMGTQVNYPRIAQPQPTISLIDRVTYLENALQETKAQLGIVSEELYSRLAQLERLVVG
jgi:hypothetical protein